MRFYLFLLLSLLTLIAQPAFSQTSTVQTPQVKATLWAHAPNGWKTNKPAWLGITLEHAPGWHTYWISPGDAGTVTQAKWNLPTGMSVGEIIWPVPQKIKIGPLTNQGFEGTVYLRAPLSWDHLPDTPLRFSVHLNWLACRVECIPQEADLSLTIDPHANTQIPKTLWQHIIAQSPSLLTSGFESTHLKNIWTLKIPKLPKAWHGKMLDVFVENPDWVAAGAKWDQRWNTDGTWQASTELAPEIDTGHQNFRIVLAPTHALDKTQQASTAPLGIQLSQTVSEPSTTQTNQLQKSALPAALAATLQAQAKDQAAEEAPSSPLAIWVAALLGAFLGGILLNLMPCVFPILAIKVISLSQGKHLNILARTHAAISYTAGCILVSLALGGLVVLLPHWGIAVGWGFQLQSPWFVALLAWLFLGVALQFAGLLRFNGIEAPPMRNSSAFASGALTVMVASPCTAPFMGAALGVALSVSPGLGLAIFAALGLGIALPIAVLLSHPKTLSYLPAPGRWMKSLQELMVFPMLGSVIWLLWVLGTHSGLTAVLHWLILSTAIGGVVWSRHQGKWLRLGGLAFFLVLLISFSLVPGIRLFERQTPASLSTSSIHFSSWLTWSPEQVNQALSRNQMVFVDFTATWCITCQFNKLTVLSDPVFLKLLDQHHVLRLRADWTGYDPRISKALGELGRNGVPTYALYRPNAKPLVFSELPNLAEFEQALN